MHWSGFTNGRILETEFPSFDLCYYQIKLDLLFPCFRIDSHRNQWLNHWIFWYLLNKTMINILNILLEALKHVNETSFSKPWGRSSRYSYHIFVSFVFIPSFNCRTDSSVWFSIYWLSFSCFSWVYQFSMITLCFTISPLFWLIEFDKQIYKNNSTDYEEKNNYYRQYVILNAFLD